MNATACLLADTICRTVELGATIDNAAVAGEFTHLFCSPVVLDPVCADCGSAGRLWDHVERKVTDLPIVGHPTRLHVRVPRFTCDNTDCETRIFQQRLPLLAASRAKTTRRCTRWIPQRLAIDRTSVSAVAKALGLGWDLVNELALSKIIRAFRDRVKVVTMDGFAGYHLAAAKAVPAARTVMDPFHVVHLAADKLTVCHHRAPRPDRRPPVRDPQGAEHSR